MGLNVTTSAKDDVEVVKKSKAQVASSYGSTPGLTQGGVTRIRNKTIPIINPIVKSSNWNTTASKRGTNLFLMIYFKQTYEHHREPNGCIIPKRIRLTAHQLVFLNCFDLKVDKLSLKTLTIGVCLPIKVVFVLTLECNA